jgi:ADP-ribose pyrophosphatase
MKPKILSKKLKYKGIWAKIEETKVKLPTRKIVKWERGRFPDFVAIVAVDSQKNIYLSKEWRVAWGKEILQIPAGGIEKENKKKMIKQARKELREEVGLDAKKLEKILTSPFAARWRQKVHIYLAQDLFESKKKSDQDEIIKVVKMPFQKAYKLFLSGKIPTTSYTILGMALAKEKLKI